MITSWKELYDWIDTNILQNQDPTDTFFQFRGQSEKTWKLTPSLTRILNNNDSSRNKADAFEMQAILDFSARSHLADSNMSYDSDENNHQMLIDMQHYSCPTRLLDWSRSPYVALYFAVNSNFDTDGALYVWQWYKYVLNYQKFHEKKFEISGDDIFKFKDHDIISIVFPSKMNNDRIVKQQGSFSLSNNILKDHDDIILEMASQANKESGLYKIIIPSNIKLEVLRNLKLMNITSENLFPGLDGLGRTINEALLIRRWKNM